LHYPDDGSAKSRNMQLVFCLVVQQPYSRLRRLIVEV